jgi:hypothetical protein
MMAPQAFAQWSPADQRSEPCDLERPGHATEVVWERSGSTFASRVLGLHFEQLPRTWCRWYAAPGAVGGRRTQVLSGLLPDPAGKTGHQLNVVVFGRDSGGAERIIAIGEAKNHAVVAETGQPARPDPGSAGSARPSRSRQTKLLLFTGNDFTPELLAVADSCDDMELVDLERLYRGD